MIYKLAFITSCIILVISIPYNLLGQKYNKDIICKAAKNTQMYKREILNNPSLFIHDNSNCVFKLLDTLTSNVIKYNDTSSLHMLDVLYGKSDGSISEYFLDIGIELFYSNFGTVIKYAYKNSENKKNNIEDILVDALSMDISNSYNHSKNDSVKSFIRKQEKIFPFSEGEKIYINIFRTKINPSKFD